MINHVELPWPCGAKNQDWNFQHFPEPVSVTLTDQIFYVFYSIISFLYFFIYVCKKLNSFNYLGTYTHIHSHCQTHTHTLNFRHGWLPDFNYLLFFCLLIKFSPFKSISELRRSKRRVTSVCQLSCLYFE